MGCPVKGPSQLEENALIEEVIELKLEAGLGDNLIEGLINDREVL